MDRIDELKKNVDTGPASAWWSKIAGKPLDIDSSDRTELEALLARTFNPETKEIAGSAVTSSEWERISPMIPQMKDNDRVFRTKLAAASRIAKEILAKRKTQYQIAPSGESVDRSLTGRRAAAEGKAESTGVEGVDPVKAAKAMKAKSQALTPQLPSSKSLTGGKAARIAAIEKVLHDHPDHSRADELREKLAELRGE